MRSVVSWSDTVPPRDGNKSTVWDLAFRPDGSQLVVAVGNRVLVYDAIDGDLLHSLKGHKDAVYTVDYSADGKRFASGGADKTIIIWTFKAEGILKYTHNESIQKIKYNPVTQQLASCTSVDFGLWSPEQKAVSKHKVQSRVLCCDWTGDGQYLALGMFNGNISIRDKAGLEKVLIERSAPVWTIAWNPSRGEPFEVLAVGCWDQTLSFYQLSGIQHHKDRKLDFDPCSVSFFSNGEYLLVGGSDKQVTLYTKDGVKLLKVADTEDWCWVARARPKQNYVATGSNSGGIAVHQLVFSTVHGLYQDRYAYRDNMTDVIVQHLITEQKVRIKCRDYIKKIAVYSNRLAVQLPDKVVIYELSNDSDPYDLHYRVRDKIHQKLDCNLLVVTSLHVILCLERKLQLFNFMGYKEKEWVLESVIRYIKVVGGPPGREGLLVGLKNGVVLRIFSDNPFPIALIKQRTSIRCLDLSASRRKLAVVDENGVCTVYDLETKEQLFQEEQANSVAWNTELEDMLCFSGNGMLSIKTGTFPIHQQKMQGFVVGFNGSKIFCLHYVAMQTIDVPQSASLYRYLESRNYSMAYKVACLGVTESDWRLLAMTALQGMDLTTARKAFIRVRDMRYLELLSSIELQRKRRGIEADMESKQAASTGTSEKSGGQSGPAADQVFMAQIMAYQGRYQEAAKVYAKCGFVDRAIDLFSDLRQWEEAKVFAATASKGAVDVKELIRRQAEWSEEVHDWKAASEMYSAAGQYDKAIEIIGERGWLDELIEVARTVDKADTATLKSCAMYFRRHGNHQYAKEVFLKMGDVQSLMKLHVELHKWEDAFILAQQHGGGKFDQDVYLPYAAWLAENDRFDEAQVAFKKAGRPDKSIRMLEQLSRSAVLEQRFKDAAYYLWLLSEEKLVQASQLEEPRGAENPMHRILLKDFETFRDNAMQYYAYGTISRYTEEPFNALEPITVFNTARYALNLMGPIALFGVSRASTLWALGKQGRVLNAFKLARYAFDKLQQLRVPNDWMDEIDLEMLTIQSKPFSDSDELLDVCYRCSTTNPLINNQGGGDACVQCSHPFVRSCVSFDSLPLVEFVPGDGCTDAQALKLLKEMPTRKNGEEKDGDAIEKGAYGETLTLNDEAPPEDDLDPTDDAFSNFMLEYEFNQPGSPYEPMKVPPRVLKQTKFDEVFVIKWECPDKRWQFFKNVIPDVRVHHCKNCHNFFHEEDLETACLSNGSRCPFCRSHIEPA